MAPDSVKATMSLQSSSSATVAATRARLRATIEDAAPPTRAGLRKP